MSRILKINASDGTICTFENNEYRIYEIKEKNKKTNKQTNELKITTEK